ncbi:MAG TPA: VanW family protein [Oscillospiraceae bacterium]|nr:VanW family protein [Oscillospiraceae bacterium]
MDVSISINKKLIKKISIAAVVFMAIICTGVYIWLFNSSKIFPNVFINDVDVGRLTPCEARTKINKWLEKQSAEFVIKLSYDGNTWNLTHEDMELYYSVDDSIEEAYKVGREGNCFRRIRAVLKLKRDPRIIKPVPDYNLSKIENMIDEISKTINKAPIDAKIEKKNGNFIITKEIPGMEVDKGVLRYNILVAIDNFDSALIDIEVGDIIPKIKEEDLNNIKDLIGGAVTVFNSQNRGRTENIKISVNAIDNTVLMPGEEFSFNDSTGPRSAEAGYKEASIIVGGEFTTGIGGGVCQVSTTLYQAALKSDMEITSRRNHGLPISYVPMGQDATVAYGYIDLKFKNSKKYPVYIEGFVRGGEVHIKLYSKKTDNIHINLKSEILEVIEPRMQVKKDGSMYLSERKISKSGNKGYRVETYKVYLQEGREIKRELVSKDYYPPGDGIIIEGTREE